MSETVGSDIDFKNKIVWILTALNGIFQGELTAALARIEGKIDDSLVSEIVFMVN